MWLAGCEAGCCWLLPKTSITITAPSEAHHSNPIRCISVAARWLTHVPHFQFPGFTPLAADNRLKLKFKCACKRKSPRTANAKQGARNLLPKTGLSYPKVKRRSFRSGSMGAFHSLEDSRVFRGKEQQQLLEQFLN